jgi:hypothetical protein
MRGMAEASKILHSDKEFTDSVLARQLRINDRKALATTRKSKRWSPADDQTRSFSGGVGGCRSKRAAHQKGQTGGFYRAALPG